MIAYLPPFISWYLLITIIGWLEFPILYKLFHRLPDRGITLAKPFGLLITVYIAWILGSYGFLRNDIPGFLFAIILAGVLGFIWIRRSGFADMLKWIREQWKFICTVELLFLFAFIGWTFIRSYNPEILGTEKPMEFMFINSILRSPTLPPHDAWFSGYVISYYYFGYMMIASLARFTNTSSSVAFNLGLSLIFALSTISSLGVTLNLIALFKNTNHKADVTKKITPSLTEFFWPSLLGPLLILIVGNFYGALELAYNNGLFAKLDIPAIWYDFGKTNNLDQAKSLADFQQPPGTKLGMKNIWEWLDLKQLGTPIPLKPDHFVFSLDNWFFASRVLHDRNLVGIETEVIDEMPAFSFLLGDLHPHLIALPFVILTIALALDWLIWGQEVISTYGRIPWPIIDRILLSSIILGSLSFLNTWDFPIYWFLIILSLVLGLVSVSGWHILIKYRWQILRLSIAILLLGVFLFSPFYLTFQSQVGGILPNIIYPTRFQQTIVMFGPLLFCVILYLVRLLLQGRNFFYKRAAFIGGFGIIIVLTLLVYVLILSASFNKDIVTFVTQEIVPLTLKEAEGLVWQRRLVDSLAILAPALMFGIILGLIVGSVRHFEQFNGYTKNHIPPAKGFSNDKYEKQKIVDFTSPPILMTLALMLTGSLLLIGPEFVYIRDVFGTRMNTVFKFYFQIWILWGLASAFGVWYILQYSSLWVKRILGWIISFIILLGLIYLPGSLWNKTNHFANLPTLDGMSYFAQSYPDDWAAIQWLNQNVAQVITGKPVILEGTKGAYWIEGRSSRISMASGIPTVIGWVNHEFQWRGNNFDNLGNREADVRIIYQERDWEITRSILDRYQIEYVIISSIERDWYKPVYINKFDRYMRRVFQFGDLIIYQRLDK